MAAIDTTKKTAADYAAIAVAPLLIFLMISSLANFLMLMLYHGGFAQRVSWTLLMFTLGAVGIARIAIERDRSYSLAYAGILGLVTFMAMLRFVDSAIFSAFILVVIAYLADVIVRDCTLIDDKIDASGQGLIDSGRLFLKNQIQPEEPPEVSGDEANPATDRKRRKTHQPGRTVMYLAFAALPLFGLGQFFLRNDPDTWARAQALLAFYLFSSLSLLVTTSFLGLRRYLRQRHVEMPGDVTVAWLAGGLAMIAAVLLVARLAPLPGKALASFELPEFLDSPGDTEASRGGWGEEGADQGNPDAPMTLSDPQADEKEVQGMTSQEGAEPGAVEDGKGDQGPAGKQDGGDKSSGGQSKPNDSASQGDQDPQSQSAKQTSSGEKASQPTPKSDSQASNPPGETPPSQSGDPQSEPGEQSQPGEQSDAGEQSQPGEQSQEAEQSNAGEPSQTDEQSKRDDGAEDQSPSEGQDSTQDQQSSENQPPQQRSHQVPVASRRPGPARSQRPPQDRARSNRLPTRCQ